jgi:hypothetical protein
VDFGDWGRKTRQGPIYILFLKKYRSFFGAAVVFFNKHKTPAPGIAIPFLGECGTYLKRRTPRRVRGLSNLVGGMIRARRGQGGCMHA